MPWIQSKYQGECNECETEFEVGELIYWKDHQAYCKKCGEEFEPQKSFNTRITNV